MKHGMLPMSLMLRFIFAAFILCLRLAAPAFATGTPATAPSAAAPAPATQTPPLLMLRQGEATHPERVILAWYKLAGTQPDFAAWAQKSPFLQKAMDMDRDAIAAREDARLRRAFAEVDTAAPITVHTKVYLDSYSTLQELLELSEFTPQTFFSFSLYGESVAIVPKDIASLGSLKITKTQMEEMLQKSRGSQVVAELILKPVVADAKTPFVHKNKSYWLLLAEIGEVRLWSGGAEPQLLWMQRADWYKPVQDQTLLNLKQGGAP